MLKYFIISIVLFVSSFIFADDVSYNYLDGPIPSYTVTSKAERMKLSFGLHNKEYNDYYHEDGTPLEIDDFDCGSDGQCQYMWQDVLDWDDWGSDGIQNTNDLDGSEGNGEIDLGETVRDGHDILFTNEVVSTLNPHWEDFDTNGSENDGINGKNRYVSNGIVVDAMYHGANGVGFDFDFLKEKRNYNFLTDILDRNLEYHPYYGYAEDFATQDLIHYNLGVYYVWNEIEENHPLLNTNQYTSPTTRILSAVYFKGSNNRTLDVDSHSTYILNAMDFMISNNIILSNQLVVDFNDKDNISPCSFSSKLIWNIGSRIALAPSFTYKKYDSIEKSDDDIYEGFVMVEGAFQFSNHSLGHLDYNLKLIPYFKMSVLGSENLIHAKNEFGLNLNIFFN